MSERFRDDPESGCRIWLGAKNSSGYGLRKVGGGDPVPKYVHRLAYEEAYGPIPDGFEIDHLCSAEPGLTDEQRVERRACCEPTHLEAVPKIENTRRSSRSKLTPAMVAEIRASSESDRVLGARYGVSGPTISRARTGATWGSTSIASPAPLAIPPVRERGPASSASTTPTGGPADARAA